MNQQEHTIMNSKNSKNSKSSSRMWWVVVTLVVIAFGVMVVTRHGELADAAVESSDLARTLEEGFNGYLDRKVQADPKSPRTHQAAKLVVGNFKKQVTSAATSKAWHGSLTVGVQADYTAEYGYFLNQQAKWVKIEFIGERMIVWLDPPSLVIDPVIDTATMKRVYCYRTGMHTYLSRDGLQIEAQTKLTGVAREYAVGLVQNTPECGTIAAKVVKDHLVDFLATMHPDISRKFRDKIEVRIDRTSNHQILASTP
jgi:hypothetical protein